MLRSETKSESDPRVDIYALGVTLMELLTGTNPFLGKSRQEIMLLHEKKSFGIGQLPEWIQEIILKAIAKTPELRFQSMIEFNQAIKSRYVPVIFDKDVIKSGDLAERANKLLKQKKWRKAIALIEYAETRFNASVNLILVRGKYHLLQKEIHKAKASFDNALKLNLRLDIQKELGWINLELKNYPLAISLLSDHLHRNPSDYEAFTLLMKCFYETSRYEAAIDLAKTILETDNENPCFTNNYYISYVLHHKGQKISPDTLLKPSKIKNHFLDYNTSVILEEVPTHALHNKPTLKSKLLFMDYRFGQFSQNTLFITVSDSEGSRNFEFQLPVIKIGREGCNCNDILLSGGTAISRRHCLIINCKNDVWLHDLSTTGIYLNNEPVTLKSPLIGNSTLRIGKNILQITDDKSRLF